MSHYIAGDKIRYRGNRDKGIHIEYSLNPAHDRIYIKGYWHKVLVVEKDYGVMDSNPLKTIKYLESRTIDEIYEYVRRRNETRKQTRCTI